MKELTTKVVENGRHYYRRWNRNERRQHWLLAASFILLVITGFALKYPDAWWMQPFRGISWLFDLRGLLHRIAGALFLLLGVYHMFYMIAVQRGRMLGKAMLPNLKDLQDFRYNVLHNLGLRKEAPEFSHFSYMEKAEYLALIWGGIIMGVTGLMLWFETLTLNWFPIWVIDLLTVIHLYEAWLATLAIIVWHFYYVIINPDIYPLNTSMVNGNLTEKELRHEYTLEWKALQEDSFGHISASDASEKAKASEVG
jgi:formate dehydrogenase gamma subunit